MPSLAAALRSLKSEEIPPDIPSTPDFLLRILSISLTVRFSWLQRYSIIAGSRSPERVPIIRPSSGVRPIDVSTHLPPIEAEIEAPLPRWHTITLAVLGSRSANLIVSLETKLWLVPWKPYLLTPYFS